MAGRNPGNEVYAISHDYGTTYSSKTFRAKNENKRSGSYERFTAKDKTVTHEPFVDRSGREGYKDEQITTTSYKSGDKNGYTEYTLEKKVKHVNYDKSSSNGKRSYPTCDSYNKVKWYANCDVDKSSSNNDSNAERSYPECDSNYKKVKWSYPKCDNNYKRVKWSYPE